MRIEKISRWAKLDNGNMRIRVTLYLPDSISSSQGDRFYRIGQLLK